MSGLNAEDAALKETVIDMSSIDVKEAVALEMVIDLSSLEAREERVIGMSSLDTKEAFKKEFDCLSLLEAGQAYSKESSNGTSSVSLRD